MTMLTPTAARLMASKTEFTLAEVRTLCAARGWNFRSAIDLDEFHYQRIVAYYTTTTGMTVVLRGEARTAYNAEAALMEYSYHETSRTAYTGAAAHVQRMQKAAKQLRLQLAKA